MAAYLLTWVEEFFSLKSYMKCVQEVSNKGSATLSYKCMSGQVQPGDKIFLLRQRAKDRGIVGFGHAKQRPKTDEYGDRRVKAVFTHLVPPEQRFDRALLNHPPLAHGVWNTRGSGVRIPDEIAGALEEAWLRHVESLQGPTPPEAVPDEASAGLPVDRLHGAGFGSPENNKLVEEFAVAYVENAYLREGWTVSSTERDGCGYDLRCTRGAEVAHVEVKGCSGSVPEFILTPGELRVLSEDPRSVLAVVTSCITSPQLTKLTGHEAIARYDFEPLKLVARLRK